MWPETNGSDKTKSIQPSALLGCRLVDERLSLIGPRCREIVGRARRMLALTFGPLAVQW